MMTKHEESILLLERAMEDQKQKQKRIMKKTIIRIVFAIIEALLFSSEFWGELARNATMHADGKLTGSLAAILEILHEWGWILILVFGVVFVIWQLICWYEAGTAYNNLAAQLKAKKNEVTDEMIAAHKWTCTCGRVLDRNISSCVCGVSQRELRAQMIPKE